MRKQLNDVLRRIRVARNDALAQTTGHLNRDPQLAVQRTLAEYVALDELDKMVAKLRTCHRMSLGRHARDVLDQLSQMEANVNRLSLEDAWDHVQREARRLMFRWKLIRDLRDALGYYASGQAMDSDEMVAAMQNLTRDDICKALEAGTFEYVDEDRIDRVVDFLAGAGLPKHMSPLSTTQALVSYIEEKVGKGVKEEV